VTAEKVVLVKATDWLLFHRMVECKAVSHQISSNSGLTFLRFFPNSERSDPFDAPTEPVHRNLFQDNLAVNI
jgi:hypothetical protein